MRVFCICRAEVDNALTRWRLAHCHQALEKIWKNSIINWRELQDNQVLGSMSMLLRELGHLKLKGCCFLPEIGA